MVNLRRVVPTAVVFCLAVAAAVADTMPKDLAAAYKSLGTAMRRLNFKAFSSIFDTDFIVVDPNSKSMNRKAFLEMVQPMFEASQSATAAIGFKQVSINGDYAEVRFEMHLNMKGKAGTVRIHEIGSDFWRKRNGRWMLYRTVEEKLDIAGPTK